MARAESDAARHAAALEESAEDLYEHAPCGYLSTLPDGTLVKVNQTFLSWTGHERDALVGRRFVELLTPGGRIYHETHYAPLLQMQQSVREIALEIVCADGRRLPVLVNSVLRQDADGRPLAIRTTVFNATDRKAYERELVGARERERAARRRTERLQRVTAALAATRGPEQIAAAVLEAIVERGGAREALFAAVDADRVAVLGSHGCTPEVIDEWEARGLEAGLAPAVALRSGELHFVEDPPADVPLSGTAAVLVLVPIVTQGRPIALIALAYDEAPAVAEEDRALLAAVAAQAAQALERAQLLAQTMHDARRSRLLAEAAHALNQAQGTDERAQLLVELLVPELADAACVEVLEEEGPRTVALAAVDASARRRLMGLEGAPVSAMSLPLRAHGRLIGSLLLSPADDHDELRDDALLAELADRAALALENARLYEREHRIAHAIQRSLLSGEPPRDPRFFVVTRYQPGVEALQVGGDWYDAFSIGSDRLLLVVGDVVGRGLEAASAMGQLRSALRALTDAETSPARVLARLDRFVAQFAVGRAATVALADIDLRSGTMRLACAGHPPPVLIAPAGPPELLWEGRSPPLGLYSEPIARKDTAVVLKPATRLLLYTDGLIERRRRPMDAGLDALLAALEQRAGLELQRLVDDLAAALVDPADAKDDVCLLGLSYHPG